MTSSLTSTTDLTHGRITLALHQLSEGAGTPLLVVHGLGEKSPSVPGYLSWDGPIWALDLTGHGQSTVPAGGGYTCELLASDVDVAMGHIGPATVLGRGLGGYLGLLAAAGRPGAYKGLIIADGPGLAGGSAGPSSSTWINPIGQGVAPDVFALAELSSDVRPAEYASSLARLVVTGSELEAPILVAARSRPVWLQAVVGESGVASDSLDRALKRYAD